MTGHFHFHWRLVARENISLVQQCLWLRLVWLPTGDSQLLWSSLYFTKLELVVSHQWASGGSCGWITALTSTASHISYYMPTFDHAYDRGRIFYHPCFDSSKFQVVERCQGAIALDVNNKANSSQYYKNTFNTKTYRASCSVAPNRVYMLQYIISSPGACSGQSPFVGRPTFLELQFVSGGVCLAKEQISTDVGLMQ